MKIKILVGETPAMAIDGIVAEIQGAVSYINDMTEELELDDAEIEVGTYPPPSEEYPSIASFFIAAGKRAQELIEQETDVDLGASIAIRTMYLTGSDTVKHKVLLIVMVLRNRHNHEWMASIVAHKEDEASFIKSLNRLLDQEAARTWTARRDTYAVEEATETDMQWAFGLINLLSACIRSALQKSLQNAPTRH